ncbi:hypothetical protein ACPXCE_28115 [Streptomyces sp. DT24]|uniref:hypothetical protein n=1 Tax=Streptomyces sp. DT24 TaxID=3416520 RepID=UPI003CF92D89
MSRFSSNTSAHHLHQIFEAVLSQNSGISKLRNGWQDALGEPWGSPEFCRKHAEAVNLLTGTINEISSLPDHQQQRILRYTPAWWSALVIPDHAWHGENTIVRLISQEALDMLASTADLIAGGRTGTAAAPRGQDLEGLRTQCEEWSTLLTEMPSDTLRDNLREGLLAQVNHLIWLIDNAATFGGSRISGQANEFVGALAQAGLEIPERHAAWRGRWGKSVYAMLVALTLFTTGSELTHKALDEGSGLVREIAQTVHEIREGQ